MGKLVLENINKIYPNGVHAIKDFNLSIEDKEFIVLIGPSGCGKSTLLRIIAGLESPTSGNLYINAQRMNNILPKNRHTSMVFQNHVLFPHMTIYQNIAFGLNDKELSKEEMEKTIHEITKELAIDNLLNRKPNEISGGQRQRVAIARALITQPSIFLLDEPLSNLDTKLKGQLRILIKEIYKKMNIPFIYVTHDQVEAMALGERIIVLKDGAIQQIGSPHEIYTHPSNQFVASFFGTNPMNFIKAGIDTNVTHLLLEDNRTIPLTKTQQEALKKHKYDYSEVIIGFRPEHVYISDDTKAHIHGQIKFVESLGSEYNLHLTYQNEDICIKAAEANIGDINLMIDNKEIHLFNIKTKLSIR